MLCSIGATHVTPTGSLTSTFGQCPGCGSMSTANGVVNPGFQQPNTMDADCFTITADYVENQNACGSTFDFVFTGGVDVSLATFSWDFGPNGFPQTSNTANVTGVAFSTAGTQIIKLSVTTIDCQRTSTFMVDASAIGFSANPILQSLACPDDTDGSIDLELLGGTAPFLFQWSTGASTELISGLSAGNYSYTVSDATGCVVTNSVTLGVPTGGLMVDVSVHHETCQGDLDGEVTVDITGGAQPIVSTWSSGQTTPTLTGIAAGTYTLEVTDAAGCKVVRNVTVGQACDPEIPEVITPNGDGINDEWVIPGIENFPNNVVRVYNRWGEVIFEQKAYMNTWAGTYSNGKLLSIGAYYYVVNLNDPDNTMLSGSITIIR